MYLKTGCSISENNSSVSLFVCCIFLSFNHGSIILGYNHGSFVLSYNHGSMILGYNHGSFVLSYNHGSIILGYNHGSFVLSYNHGKTTEIIGLVELSWSFLSFVFRRKFKENTNICTCLNMIIYLMWWISYRF